VTQRDKVTVGVVTIVALMVLAAGTCKKEPPPEPPPDTIPVSMVVLPETITVRAGEPAQFCAFGRTADSTPIRYQAGVVACDSLWWEFMARDTLE
jgi:hypothetical protein